MINLEEIILNAINDLLNNYYDKNNLKELYEKVNIEDTDNQNTIKVLEKEEQNLEKKINKR